MAFLDDISSFTKGVGAKAKGNYDVVNLNSRVSAVQKEIKVLYEQLGTEYYAVKKDFPDESLIEIVEKINQKYAEINSLQNEIEETKNNLAAVTFSASKPNTGRFCVNCGEPIEIVSLFCTKCGSKQPEYVPPVKEEEVAEEPVVVYNTPVEESIPEVVYNAPVSTAEDKPEENSGESAVVTENDFVFCTECGAKIPSDSLFCTECGTRI